MREIKFRAWDDESKIMFYCGVAEDGRILIPIEKSEYYEKTVPEFFDYRRNFLHEVYSPDAVLMQYTGLKDRNGVEVYEGDILVYAKKSYSWSDKSRQRSGVVIFDSELFSYRVKNFDSEMGIGLGHLEDYYFERVGDIYTNPELLGATDAK